MEQLGEGEEEDLGLLGPGGPVEDKTMSGAKLDRRQREREVVHRKGRA